VNGAKPKLFEPKRKNELSVFDAAGRPDKETCELGIEPVARPKGRRLHGWAKVTSTDIEEVELKIVGDDNPSGH